MLVICPPPQTVFRDSLLTALALLSTVQNSALENVMNKDLAKVYNWLQANNFHLNPPKSNYLIFAPKINPTPSEICLTINDTQIPYSNNVKYLEVHINPKFNFQAYIRATKQRISKSNGIISKLKYFLLTCAPLKLYYAFVHPTYSMNLSYGDPPIRLI